jgi:hypothetical protein
VFLSDPAEDAMGAIDVWEVESSTEIEAARGRSTHPCLTARHRDLAEAKGILPSDPPYRFCDLTWFPRFISEGDRRRFTLYQVRGVPGLADGAYTATPPDATVTVILHRWFGDIV